MDLNSFHNSINESGQTLIRFESEAKTQEEIVMNVFLTYSRAFSWCEVMSFLPSPMNQVSLKRSITNLFNQGKLQKTNEKVMGIYGKNCHRYKLV
jgi:hypothetical protein